MKQTIRSSTVYYFFFFANPKADTLVTHRAVSSNYTSLNKERADKQKDGIETSLIYKKTERTVAFSKE